MRRLVETSKQKSEIQKKIWLGTLAAILLTSSAFAQKTPITNHSVPQSRQIVVSLADRQLVLVENGRPLKVYAIAVGADASPSPEGDFKVINRLENPGYYKPGTVIEPGAGNPLGTRWIGLSQKGYGIHGTNAPGSIGKAASHGCIRMHQRDLEELFKMVRVGDTVSIRGERDEQLARLLNPDAAMVAVNQSDAANVDGDDSAAAVEIEK
jgi:lipoprotein-anchoring transpeptidase ErfK/SrfK